MHVHCLQQNKDGVPTLESANKALRFLVYGLWFMIAGLWFMVFGWQQGDDEILLRSEKF